MSVDSRRLQAGRPGRCGRRLGLRRRTTATGSGPSCSRSQVGDPVPALDVTRKVARVDLDGRTARRVGSRGDQSAIWRRVLDDLAVAVCAELVGTCERALVLAVEYAKVARPIRPADRHVPGDQAQGRRHAPRARAGEGGHALRSLGVGRRITPTASARPRWRRDSSRRRRTWSPPNASRSTAGSASRGTSTATCSTGRAKQDDLLFGAQGYQRERLADLLLGPVRESRIHGVSKQVRTPSRGPRAPGSAVVALRRALPDVPAFVR